MDKTSGGSTTRTVTYYPVAGAMRIDSTLYYILKDHLGSASVVTNSSGSTVGEDRFYPFGETRLTTGSIYTDRLFTGQREMAGLGIYHFNARFYSPKLGRFLSADSIVPNPLNPQDLNRFSYVLNNPLRYTDPTGHVECRTQEECQDMGTTPGGGFSIPKPTSGGGGGGSGGTGGDGGQPLPNIDPNTGDEGTLPIITTPTSGTLPSFTQTSSPPVPCELTDCILSAVSILASGVITAFGYELPVVGGVAFIVDVVVTVVAVGHTNRDYKQGEISKERQWILNGTGILGALPIGPFGVLGLGLSIINGMATFSGYPP